MKDGSFAYEGLTRVLHERARLSAITALSTSVDGRTFGELKRLCGLTDGNLNRHLKVLEEEALVRITKRGGGRTAETRAKITAKGKRAFLTYLAELEKVLMDARSIEDAEEERPEDGPENALA